MHVAPPATGPINEQDLAEFIAALEQRREQVYDYLDAWPGAHEFKPIEIHDAIYSYVKRRGKALRPLVLLLCCGAVGGDEEQAVPAAAAVEVFHTWTLVHDDIIDRDDTRRGSPTVHAEYATRAVARLGLPPEDAAHYGRAVAILAGDSQQSWSYALLCDLESRGVEPRLVLELTRRMAMSLTPLLLEGEMLDVQYALASSSELSEGQVLDMLTKKTAALLEYAAWCGARIGLAKGQGDAKLAGELGRFARLCGTAFQLHDDLLGLTADEAKLGKPVGSDIREGKRTLILYRALGLADESQRQQILRTLGNSLATNAEIAQTLDAIRSTGALDQVRELANSLIGQALAILQTVPDTPQRKLLASWATFLLAREH
jgi:geranylgeranyl diphosphate synthase, type I